MKDERRKAPVINILTRRKLPERQKPKNNLYAFPVIERKAEICEKCEQEFYGEVCPDCGPESET